MSQMIMLILDDIEKLPEILKVWREIGVPGATILRSAGAHRASTWLEEFGLNAINNLFENREVPRKTLLVVLDDEDLLQQAVAEAERVMGGFDRANSGILMVLPVNQVMGLRKRTKVEEPAPPPAMREGWKQLREVPIAEVEKLLDLEPISVGLNATLEEAAQAMLTKPGVNVACVTSEEGALKGLLTLETLTDDLFYHILPEEFLSEVSDVEKLMDYAGRTRIRTAEDAMSEPVWVKMNDTVRDAFVLMHQNKLPGIPVIDDKYHVVGYINQLELLAACLTKKALKPKGGK